MALSKFLSGISGWVSQIERRNEGAEGITNASDYNDPKSLVGVDLTVIVLSSSLDYFLAEG